MTVADGSRGVCTLRVGVRQSSVARAQQRRLELVFDQPLDELTCPRAHSGLERVQPVVEKLGRTLYFSMRNRRMSGSFRHGVVSNPAR